MTLVSPLPAPHSLTRSVGLFVLEVGAQIQVRGGAVALPGSLDEPTLTTLLNELLPTRSSVEPLLRSRAQPAYEREPGGNFLLTPRGWVALLPAAGVAPLDALLAEEAEEFEAPEHNQRSFHNMTKSHVFDADRAQLREQFSQARNQAEVDALIGFVAAEIKNRPRSYPPGKRPANYGQR